MDDAAPPGFLCPIHKSIMRDPVARADGHSCDRPSIERWLQSRHTSPNTGAPLEDLTLTENHALRNSIEEWLASNFRLVALSAITIEDVIARGSTKTVYRGSVRGHLAPIAVSKMAVAGGSLEEEAAVLVKLCRHPGLVRYLGICTEGPEQFLLTELAQHGSLDVFLEQHEDTLTLPHKFHMLAQACSAMEAISFAGLVHRDLAARNLLVFEYDAQEPRKTVVKITDFGLAVNRHYQTHAYAQGEELPFRWMAPEALRRRRFSEKSDVWAFGVLAWELFSGGDVPYAFISSSEQVAERVCSGHRLEQPEGCPRELWDLVLCMWETQPQDRPTFALIRSRLAQIEGLFIQEPTMCVHFNFNVLGSGCAGDPYAGKLDLPKTVTFHELLVAATGIVMYPAKSLNLELFEPRNTSRACSSDPHSRPLQNLTDDCVFMNADGIACVAITVCGDCMCQTCRVMTHMGYDMDEHCLTGRYGGSWDLRKGVMFMMRCFLNRRQCGPCWCRELGDHLRPY